MAGGHSPTCHTSLEANSGRGRRLGTSHRPDHEDDPRPGLARDGPLDAPRTHEGKVAFARFEMGLVFWGQLLTLSAHRKVALCVGWLASSGRQTAREQLLLGRTQAGLWEGWPGERALVLGTRWPMDYAYWRRHRFCAHAVTLGLHQQNHQIFRDRPGDLWNLPKHGVWGRAGNLPHRRFN